MPLEELLCTAERISTRRGWDFSRVREDRDPVPWEYGDLVRRYLRPTTRVLDIGTGGGEKLLSLAPSFGSGTGVDSDPMMVQVALENTPPSLQGKVSFQVMDAADLRFPPASFEVVLNRHCTVFSAPVVRVLRPGGVFVTQQVGRRTTENILAVFGWGPESYGEDWWQEMGFLADEFERHGCQVVARAEYNVRYWFQDLESLFFWFLAAPFPEEITVEKHWRQIDEVITRYTTPRGIETNEHRELLIVRKLP